MYKKNIVVVVASAIVKAYTLALSIMQPEMQSSFQVIVTRFKLFSLNKRKIDRKI